MQIHLLKIKSISSRILPYGAKCKAGSGYRYGCRIKLIPIVRFYLLINGQPEYEEASDTDVDAD